MQFYLEDGTTPMPDADILAFVKDAKSCAVLTLVKDRRDAIIRAHGDIDKYVNKYMKVFADDLIATQAADDELANTLTLRQRYKLADAATQAAVDALLPQPVVEVAEEG
jgi:hypothetical protein